MTNHLKTYDLERINDKSMINIANDDDQDIYISERSSIASSNDFIQTSNSNIKRLPTPTPSPPITLLQKQPHTLRYSRNELSENGIPPATPFRLQHKGDKKKKQNLRKVPFSELNDNHYPYWYPSKAKHPECIMRSRQTIPHESFDSHQPSLTTSSIKPRKSHHNGVTIIQSNQTKHRQEYLEKNLSPSPENNHQQQTIPLKIVDNDEPTKRTISQQRRKLKIENDSIDHNIQSTQDSNSLMITSTTLTNRIKNRSKLSDKNSLTNDTEENNKHRYHHQNPPSIPSQQNHHHHYPHLHIRRRPPSGANLTSEFHVVDVSFKKPERSPYFQQVRDPTSPIHNQSPYLPLIIPDHHHKTHTTRFPTEYYGTLARQAHGRDWHESLEVPKIYKHDPQSRFHDRYLHTVVDKRQAA